MATTTSVTRLWAWSILLLMGVAWGLSFSLAKLAVAGGGHPLGITLWQAMLGALFLGAVTLGRGRVISLKSNFLVLYLICALLGTAIPGVLFYYAARHVPAGVLSITVTLVPILTVFLAVLLRVERLALSRVTGVLCGTLAVILLVGSFWPVWPRPAMPSRTWSSPCACPIRPTPSWSPAACI
jgi:drug/metabolite transporter (DMT)-like permease